jgi:hypothetical protein
MISKEMLDTVRRRRTVLAWLLKINLSIAPLSRHPRPIYPPSTIASKLLLFFAAVGLPESSSLACNCWTQPSGFGKVDRFGATCEAACSYTQITQPYGEPDSTCNLGDYVEIQPNQSTERKAQQVQNCVNEYPWPSLLAVQDCKVPKDRKIHTHEGEECTEVKKFAGVFIGTANVVETDRPYRNLPN